MSFVRGERVHFDFDSGHIDPVGSDYGDAPSLPPLPTVSAAFVGDIQERATPATNAPSAPTFKANTTGFPAHKKRGNRVSAFKQQRAGRADVPSSSQDKQAAASEHSSDYVAQEERRQIDEENKQRLAEMSPEEIEQERNDLLAALSPSLIQKLLGRANLDEGSNERDLGLDSATAPPTNDIDIESKPKPSSNKKVAFEEPEEAPGVPEELPAPSATDPKNTSQSNPLSTVSQEELGGLIHFPKPPQPPDLDPNSPSFLEDLHQKYFANLPYDPSSLSWMQPIDPSDTSSPYHPAQVALNASELRFDFKGALLAPSKARELPVTDGLHHHAEAPEAAGYTIPELARLARSAVPAQRCIAYQTLGRVLYRLGSGEFGQERDTERQVNGPVNVAIDPSQAEKVEKEELEIADTTDDASSAMATGLWNCIEEGKVIETLTQEAAKEKGHLTSRTYAQEALWNWRRGGGRKRRAV
jgi:hypothetical protein